MVTWIIGLSGAGKTVLGRKVYQRLRKTAPNTVFVDGDEIRAVFKHDRGDEPYTISGRKKNADRICELCAWLDRQEINVVCCILSIFEESRQWNRLTYSNYYEVYISVPESKLRQRDIKNLYAPADRGEVKHVVGVDIPFPSPKNPDFIFDNTRDDPDFDGVADQILTEVMKQ